jgi:cation diffusion facilitator CzcD-associated flavoprotein CzcO
MSKQTKPVQFDVLIIGAGQTGMYQLLKLRELGYKVKAFEAGGDVGGAWYWNRYPGARLDSESFSYGYSFSPEVLNEWNWSEVFPSQEENFRYYSFVADKYDLRRDIQFNTRIVRATYDENAVCWEVESDTGEVTRATFLITAMGPLSALQMPAVPGRDDFEGDSWHTAEWPRDPEGFGAKPYDFEGKRVGVVGTGSTGVQVIQELSKLVEHLYVFQRTGNWCAPLGNSKIDATKMEEIRKNYPAIFEHCNKTFGSFMTDFAPKSGLEVSDEEREAFFEQLYNEPGFGIWLGVYYDAYSNKQVNQMLSDFIARKIRQRVRDPKVADQLIPKDHGFGLRRVPLETNFYECFNQPNVTLVDLKTEPFKRIRREGIETTAKSYDLDVIIYATGFDAITGAFKRVDIRGVGGQSLKEKWAQGPLTYLGVQTAGFPNLFMLVGAHTGSTFCNMPRCIEHIVEWTTDLFRHMRDHKIGYVEARLDKEREWTQEVYDAVKDTLFITVDSWFNGKNHNDPNRVKAFLMYAGGQPKFREILRAVADNGYKDFITRTSAAAESGAENA